MNIHHKYVATNVDSGYQHKYDTLPDLMRFIRDRVKIPHGNKIRTILLEEGVYCAQGKDRKNRIDKYGDVVFHRYDITVERWESLL